MAYPEFVQFRASDGTLKALATKAEAEGRTLSEMLRSAITVILEPKPEARPEQKAKYRDADTKVVPFPDRAA